MPPYKRVPSKEHKKELEELLKNHLIHLPMRVVWYLLDIAKSFSLEAAAIRAKAEMKATVEMVEVQAAEEERAERRIKQTRLAAAGAAR